MGKKLQRSCLSHREMKFIALLLLLTCLEMFNFSVKLIALWYRNILLHAVGVDGGFMQGLMAIWKAFHVLR